MSRARYTRSRLREAPTLRGLPREREVDDEILLAAFAALDRLTATEIPPDQAYR